MNFRYPNSFFAIIPFVLLIFLYSWSRMKRLRDLSKLGDWNLLKQLLSVDALIRRRRKDIFALFALGFLILAACGPQFGSNLKEVKQRGVDVFIAIDTSRSMMAEDMAPSRLEHAKRALGLLVDKLAGNRIGIIAFAKYPIIQCPLTVDSEAARMFLDIVDVNTVPQQGTSIGEAIRLATKSFNLDEKTGKVIVLLTDGEDHESDPTDATKAAKEKGIVLFTIGIGTSKGEVIKDRDEQGNITSFHKYKGEMVVSRMDDALLTKIANLTGGHYYHASTSDREIDEIADALNSFDKKEFSSKIFERLEERYQLFALLALLLLIFEFFFAENPGQLSRINNFLQTEIDWEKIGQKISFKKKTVSIIVILFSISNANADMKDHVMKGAHLAEKQDFAGARVEFESAQIDAPEMPLLPYNIGLTYYGEGSFEEAKKQFEKTLAMTQNPQIMANTHYNLGHVAYAQGKKDDAIREFKECLKINSKDEDAKYNIEYIKSGKSPKNPPPQQNKQSQNQNQDQKDNKNKSDQNKDNQQQNQQEKKPGQLSKEDAERILQMMKDQEKDRLKNAQKFKAGQNKKDKKDDQEHEDW